MKIDKFISLYEYWNSKKVFIDKDLWYIENILTEEEINEIMSYANEKNKWYKTMRAASIRNKFIGVDVETHPEGTICPTRGIDLSGDALYPDQKNSKKNIKDLFIFYTENGIFDRLRVALPQKLVDEAILQSFWPLSEEEIKNPGGAYDWHFEKGHDGVNNSGMTAAWSLYLNDDFEGGVLEFLDKPYSIKARPGMLISIPMTKDFTHRVTPVTQGIRHTLYGTCYEDINDRYISTAETC